MLYFENIHHLTKKQRLKKRCDEFWICIQGASPYVNEYYKQLTNIGVSKNKIFCKRSLALPSKLDYNIKRYINISGKYGEIAILAFNELFKPSIINYYTDDEYAQKTIKLLKDKISNGRSICIVSTASPHLDDMSHEKILYNMINEQNGSNL